MDKRKRWGNPDIMVRIAMYLCLLTLSWVQVKGEVNTTVADVVWEIPIPHAMSDYQPGDVAYLYNKDVKGFFLGDNEYGTRASFSASKGYKVKLEASDDEKPGTFLITSFVETKEQWLQTCCNDANGAGNDIWVDRIAQTAYHWVVSRNGDYYRFENAERREAGREGDYLGAILNSGNTRLFLCSEEFYPDKEFGVDWFFVDPLEYDRVTATYNAAVALKEEIDAAKEKYKDDIDLSGPEMVYCNTSSTLDELLQALEAVKQAILDFYIECDGIAYHIISGTTVEVIPLLDGSHYSGNVVIPETVEYNGKTLTVVSIGYDAFNGCQELEGIELPSSIKLISSYAFAGIPLASVVLPSSVETIEDFAFGGSRIEDITIPASVTVLGSDGNEVFYQMNNLMNIYVEDGNPVYTSVDGVLFNKDKGSLVRCPLSRTGIYEIPSSITVNGQEITIGTIDVRAFQGCKLSGIVIPETIESIGGYAFQWCFDMVTMQCLRTTPIPMSNEGQFNDVRATVYVPEGSYEAYMSAEMWKDRTIIEGEPIPDFEYEGIAYSAISRTTVEVISLLDGSQYSGNVVIPETVEYNGKTFVVTSIGDRAFADCKDLQSVSISSTVETIQSHAFDNSSLKSLALPASVKSIARGAFVSGSLSFIQCLGTEPAVCQDDWIVNDGVKIYVPDGSYDAYMSAEVWKDKNIIEGEPIPDFEYDGIAYSAINSTTVEVIPLLDGESRYVGDVVVPETVEYNGKTFVVTSIGDRAFADCKDLQSVSISSTVETIQSHAFDNSSLKSLALPASVKSIARGAFVSGSLSVIQCLGAEPAVCQDDWIVNDGVIIYVPEGSYDAYMSAEVWKDKNIIEGEPIPDFEYEGIAYQAIDGATVKVIPLLDGSHYSGDVVVPETVDSNGKTFVVTSIGSNAFRDCGELQSVSLPSTVETIQTYAFAANSLKYLVLPASVKSIGDGAFVWGNLLNIQCLGAEPAVCKSGYIFKDGVKIYVLDGSYEAYMSAEVWKDQNIVEGELIPDFEYDGIAYQAIDGATVAVIPLLDGSQYSGDVVIPETVEYNGKTLVVTSIGDHAFFNCKDLQSVSLPSTVETIQSWAFAYTSLKSLVLPASVKSIARGAFVRESLSFIQCLGTEPAVCQDDWIFNDGVKIYVPDGSYDAYMSAEVWKDKNIIEGEPIPNFEADGIAYCVTGNTTVEVIPLLDGESRYAGDVVIPETVEYNGKPFVITSIGSNVFRECWELQSVSLPSTVETIQSYAFEYTSLKSLVLPASVKSIARGAFDSGSLSFIQCLGAEPAVCQGDWIFNDDVKIYVPEGSYEAYMSAEVWKDKNIIEGEPIPDFEYDGIAYQAIDGATVAVIPLLDGESRYAGDVIIPETVEYNGKTFVVTSIGSNAFWDCWTLQSVSLPSTVETIQVGAFVFNSLKSLVLPASVKSIDEAAFVEGNLSVIQCLGTEPAVCQSDYIFNEGVKIYVPDGSYDAYMSAEVWKDQNIIEGEPIPDFEYDGIAYQAIDGATVAVIPLLDGSRYSGDVVIPETVEYNGKTLVVTSIGTRAFYGSRDLQSVSLPSTVETIQTHAFASNSLKYLVLPASVKSIGGEAFVWGELSTIQCLGAEPAVCLSGIIFNEGVKIYVPEGSYEAYISAEVWKDRPIIEGEPIPNFEADGIAYCVTGNNTTVEVIPLLDGESRYAGDVVIPETVEYDGKTFVITSIGEDAFCDCGELQSVSLPSTVETIQSFAFVLNSLKSLVLPASVKSIGEGAFVWGELSTIQCLGAEPAVCQGDWIFNDGMKIYVPDGSYEAYMSAEVWKDQNIVEGELIPDFEYDGIAYSAISNTTVEVIPLLDGSQYSGDVVIPETVEYNGKTFVVTSIGSNAFGDCGELQSVSLPSTVETIQTCAFAYTSLKSLVLPASVKSIGDGAFVWGELSTIQCLGAEPAVCLSDIIFDEGVKIYVPDGSYEAYISAEVWKDRPIIEGEPIPNFEYDGIAYSAISRTTVEVISLLDGSQYSGDVVVPETVEYNGKTFVVTSIGTYAFADCWDLQSVSLPSTVETIRLCAFVSNSLKSLVLPASVKSIDFAAFMSESLSVIQCLGAEPAVCQGDDIFNDGVKIYVPEGSYDAYMSAEVWKDQNIIEGEPIHFDGIAYSAISRTTVEVIPLLDGSHYSGDVVVPETVEYNGKTFVVTSIGMNAFRDCGELQSVSLPSTVETIQTCAFAYTSLKSLVLPASVKSIGDGAFIWGELSTIQCLGAEPAVCQGDWIFSNEGVKICVPEGSYEAYMSAEVWKDQNIFEGEPIPDFEYDGIAYQAKNGATVKVIPLLDGSHYSGDVIIPETVEYNGKTFVVTSIGTYAFWDCWDLQSVSLPSTVETIRSHAFASNSLKSLVLPASVKSIADYAFTDGNLSVIQCLGAEPAVCQRVYDWMWIFNDGVTIYVPKGSYDAYMSAEVWKDQNIIELESAEEFEYALSEGWNWISVNVRDNSVLNAETMLAGIGDAAEYMASRQNILVNDPEYGWTGGLADISYAEGYKLKMNADAVLSFYGTRLLAGMIPVTVRSGWNWIGYVPYSAQWVSAALADHEACEGDVVKGQDDFAIYSNGVWNNDFVMKPGQGYMYYSATEYDRYFCYAENALATEAPARTVRQKNSYWEYDAHRYADNMALIAKVAGDEDGIYTVGAFVGDECRGSSVGNDMLFITVHGDGDAEQVSFRIMDTRTNVMYEARETVEFASLVGSMASPVVLTLGDVVEPTNVAATDADIAVLFDGNRLVVKGASGMRSVRVADTNGIELVKKTDVSEIDLSALPRGIYIVVVDNGATVITRKIVKK